MNQILEHFGQLHNNYVKTNASNYKANLVADPQIYQKEWSWVPSHLKLDGHNFFACYLRKNTGIWYLWVYIAGTLEESQEYIFMARILSQDQLEQLTYEGNCVSVHIKKEDINSVGRCLTFTDETAKHFGPNDKINFEFKVNRNPKYQI